MAVWVKNRYVSCFGSNEHLLTHKVLEDKFGDIFLDFQRKYVLIFHVNYLLRQLTLQLFPPSLLSTYVLR